jgi:twinkle protein
VSDDPILAWDRDVAVAPPLRTPVELAQHSAEEMQHRPKPMLAWLEGLGISEETTCMFGLYSRPWRFKSDPGRQAQPAVVFPYRLRGKVVNRAYRHPQGWAVEYESDAWCYTLFNIDAVDETTPQELVLAQRELDVLALHEAGFPQTVALPQIAAARDPDDVSDPEPDETRFLALRTHAAMLGAASKIVLAMDRSMYGEELREALARRLGRHRCWVATWPDGCETAGQVLKRLGAEVLAKAIADAEPYPIDGLHRLTEETLLALRRRKKPPTMGTGVGVLDRILRLPTDGRLIVVTGIPNHGKTPFVRHLAMHTMERHGRRWAVFSPEMRPWERFAASCAEWLVGKSFWPPRRDGNHETGLAQHEVMSDEELRNASWWLRDRLFMLVNDAEAQRPTVDWLLELARITALRDGTTDLWIDPWNEMAHQRPVQQREDEYIGESLQRLLAFGNRYGCNVWVNVHPVTLRPRPGEKLQPPGPYDIAGGAMWFNKADLMLTVFRPADSPLSQIIVRKAKDPEWGRRGDSAELAYSVDTGRYSTPIG